MPTKANTSAEAASTQPTRYASAYACLLAAQTGRLAALSAADKARVEAALAADAELALRLDIIRDDMAETTLLNESLGAPSPRVLDRLMAGVEAEPRRQGLLATAKGGFMTWLGQLLATQPPRRLAYAGAAACALIALQGVALTGILLREQTGFETASTALMSVQAQVDAIAARMKAEAAIVRFVAPAP